MIVNEEECIAAGFDPAEVKRIAKNLSKWGREADRLGLTIFGGAGHGSLRAVEKEYPERPRLILARIDGYFDGGDGGDGVEKYNDGLERGE